MRLISFDPFRSLGLPAVTYLKPERMFAERERLRGADWLLFPRTWQVDILDHVLRARLFPSPASYRLGRSKIEITRALLAGFPEVVPETLILPGGRDAADAALAVLSLPLVVKEPRSSEGRGVHLIESARELYAWAAQTPVLYVQEYLPIDADLRVVWIGDRVVTAYWRRGGDGFRHNLAQGGETDFDAIPEPALDLVARIAPALGIDHAGFDLAVVDGHWYLLEFNVLFGNQGLGERGIRLAPLLLDYLERRTRDDEPPWPALPRAV